MKTATRIGAALLGATILATSLVGCSATVSPEASPSADSRNADATIKGSRLCYTSTGPSGMQVRGSSFLNNFFSWKGWDTVASGQEYCLEDFVSTSVMIDRYGNGVEKMWADIKNEVRFGDGSKVNFFGDNPLIGYPMVGWSTTGNESGWEFTELSEGRSKSASAGARTFTVERRTDSTFHKEFLITFTG
jgi:hypothetical protein